MLQDYPHLKKLVCSWFVSEVTISMFLGHSMSACNEDFIPIPHCNHLSPVLGSILFMRSVDGRIMSWLNVNIISLRWWGNFILFFHTLSHSTIVSFGKSFPSQHNPFIFMLLIFHLHLSVPAPLIPSLVKQHFPGSREFIVQLWESSCLCRVT